MSFGRSHHLGQAFLAAPDGRPRVYSGAPPRACRDRTETAMTSTHGSLQREALAARFRERARASVGRYDPRGLSCHRSLGDEPPCPHPTPPHPTASWLLPVSTLCSEEKTPATNENTSSARPPGVGGVQNYARRRRGGHHADEALPGRVWLSHLDPIEEEEDQALAGHDCQQGQLVQGQESAPSPPHCFSPEEMGWGVNTGMRATRGRSAH